MHTMFLNPVSQQDKKDGHPSKQPNTADLFTHLQNIHPEDKQNGSNQEAI